MLFTAWWTHYLDSASAADPVRIPLSLLLSELSSCCVNAVRLHVTAANVLVRCGVDSDDSRQLPFCPVILSWELRAGEPFCGAGGAAVGARSPGRFTGWRSSVLAGAVARRIASGLGRAPGFGLAGTVC